MRASGRFRWNATLQRRIGLIIVVELLLAIGVFGYLGLTATGRSTEARLQERLTIALLVADYEDQMLGIALASLDATASSAAGASPPRLDQAQTEVLFAAFLEVGMSIVDVALLDPGGRPMWTLQPWSERTEWSLEAYPGLRKTLAGGEATVSGMTTTPSITRPVVILATGLPRDGGALVVAVDLAGSNIAGFMKPIKLGDTGYAELVDHQGVVLARTLPGRAPSILEKSDHPERFASLIALGEPVVGTCHRCHVQAQETERREDVLAFAPLKRASWGVVIRQSAEEALAPTLELRRALIVAGAVMSAITLILIWLATSDVVRRIRALKEASLRMASGDLASPIATRGRDELGTLAETMDATRLELKASYDAVERRTRELGALLAVSQTLTSVADVSATLDALLAKVVEVVPGSEGGLLLLHDRASGTFTVTSAAGTPTGAGLKGAVLPAGIPSAGASGVPCAVSPDLSPDSRALTEAACSTALDRLDGHELLRAAAAPLISKGELTGAVVLLRSTQAKAFDDVDLSLLRALANEIAMAVEHVRLSQQAEQARVLVEADRVKSEFLSAVSHELRTPLTSIKGYATTLLRDDVQWDVQTTREFLKAIDQRADDLRDLIDKLLQMARVETGDIQLRREPVLLNHLAREVVVEVVPPGQRARVTVEFPTPFPVVEADPDHMKIVLRNLVDNAIKYSPNGGDILVSGHVHDDRLVVQVLDHGKGIPEAHLPRVFERFYRVHEGNSPARVSGSGLGLAVVKALVEAHGGKVWVESMEGRGSSFFFSLPMETVSDGETDVHTGGGRRPAASPVR